MRALPATMVAGGLALCLGAGTAVSQMAAAAFHNLFEGSWRGAGTVQRSVDPSPRRVNCSVTGQASEQRIAIGGTCRAAVIFSRAISADVSFDPASGRYVGTYTGSQAGPARLQGTRQGNTLNLTVTYAQPVGPDNTARMVIRHNGANQFSITVMDQLEAGQPEIPTTQLTFTQA